MNNTNHLQCVTFILILTSFLARADDGLPSGVTLNIQIKQLPTALEPQRPLIESNITAATKFWLDLVDCKPCEIKIAFEIRDAVEGDPQKRGYGKSAHAASFTQKRQNGKHVEEQGLAHLLRTGKHASQSGPDVQIGFQTAYVLREFCWDPEPLKRVAPVSKGHLDAVSVIMHELGHAMAFNGWRDPKTGKLKGDFMSTYDRWVRFNNGDFYFDGPEATKIYGRPILLARTLNNYHHLGDKRVGIPHDELLNSDLMSGYYFQWAHRYAITPLDIAVLKDCGVPLRR